jgi:hypothetical protein
MSLKLTYYGQNDSVNCTPAIALSGDPGTDQQNLTNAGYLGGVIVALTSTVTGYAPGASYVIQSANEPAFGTIGNIVPCDRTAASTVGNIPFATLLNGPGEFAGAIGPSGSKKAPVVRALWQGNVDSQAYGGTITNFAVGQYVYCGGSTSTNKIGKYVASGDKESGDTIVVGICTHVPTAPEPWLGVASLL